MQESVYVCSLQTVIKLLEVLNAQIASWIAYTNVMEDGIVKQSNTELGKSQGQEGPGTSDIQIISIFSPLTFGPTGVILFMRFPIFVDSLIMF